MGKARIAISLDESILERLDFLVNRRLYTNRSRAIQQAVEEKLERVGRSRLARECAKLDPRLEKALAEEGLSEDVSKWPAY